MKHKGYRNSILSYRGYITLFIAIVLSTLLSTLVIYQVVKYLYAISLPTEIVLIISRFATILGVTVSVFFVIINAVSKSFLVDKPVKRILHSTDRITAGDFTVRITDGVEEHIRTEFDLIAYRLDKMAEELEGVETIQVDFMSNISHEMKTPLATIQNYSMLIQGEEDPEKIREYTRIISSETKKFSNLMTNILRLNKLENQKIFQEKKRYDLAEQLRVALLDAETLWSQKEISIESDLPENFFIQADSELLDIVWNNLISNAIKFTPNGGTISVSLKEDEKGTIVSIKDSGIGMSEGQIKRVFDKFYQADRSHKMEGNGLGLALVSKIMDITGAKISVESEEGKGSTFSVLFPLEIYY